MISKTRSKFSPDYAIHPGEILKDELNARGISQKELAERVGASEKHISLIINSNASISAEMSVKLEKALGIKAHIWINLQSQLQEHEARIKEDIKLGKTGQWAGKFPVEFMIENKWLKKREAELDQLNELLSFFGVASPAAWEVIWSNTEAMYRKAHDSDKYALATWLRKGEIEALNLECKPYNEALFKDSLNSIRPLTSSEPRTFIPMLRRTCADCGVAVAFVPQTPGSKICGAARWLDPSKALIQLSLRYKKNDILWFTFFHEAAHLVLHKKKTIYLEKEKDSASEEENEADEFAANLLIPKKVFESFVAGKDFSESSIRQLAESQNISPAIVLGRIQKYGLVRWNSKLNKNLKLSLGWATPNSN